jgi:hypothetical protein
LIFGEAGVIVSVLLVTQILRLIRGSPEGAQPPAQHTVLFVVPSRWVELSGCGDSADGGGDDVVGEIDQSAPGGLWQRDQLIGRDLAARGPVTPS